MEWWAKAIVNYMAFSLLASIPVLFWFVFLRRPKRQARELDKNLILLFSAQERDTDKVHPVYFSESYGIICPTLGNTYGRYENLTFMCPDYEYRVVSELVSPSSFRIQDLHNSVGTWIDSYWQKKFES